MISAPVMDYLGDEIGAIDIQRTERVSGGSINRCFKLVTRKDQFFFVKINQPDRLEMFEAESDGLSALKASGAIRVPDVIKSGVAGGVSFLLLEFLYLDGKTSNAEVRLGESLAQQHQYQGEQYGWHRDNTIGRTPQVNTESSDWIRFFAEHRLGYQINLAMRNGYTELCADCQDIIDNLPVFFEDYEPEPALLHGDLWGGNWDVTVDGQPVVFDPAVYFGDREADIAMTQLFGGFGSNFYSAYNRIWPLDQGFKKRRDIYNLYHVLNHLNLFGAGYLGQAARLISRLHGRHL